MQVSIYVERGEPIISVGFVAFEFGSIRDPHEFLQDEARCKNWVLGPNTYEAVCDILMDKHRGLLNRRGFLWASPEDLRTLRGLGPPAWDPKQELDPATLIWAARRVPSANFRVPPVLGLDPKNSLHSAIQQAVLLQGALRALCLHRDYFKSPKVLLPPTM